MSSSLKIARRCSWLKLLENIGEIDWMNVRQLFLQHVELHIAFETAHVVRQRLDVGPGNGVLVVDFGRDAADEVGTATSGRCVAESRPASSRRR